MSEIILKEENGQVLASSREVAEKFGKRHTHVLDSINNILKSSPELSSEFILSHYKATNGKLNPYYILSKKGLSILETKYTYSAMSPRFEFKFGNMLREMFPSEKIFAQYPILNYRIDFFMPDVNMIIEYDEEQHKYSKEEDIKRIKEIKAELNKMVVIGEPLYNGCSNEPNPWLEGKDIFSVVRVKKGKEIEGLRNICIGITENTNQPCSDFMKLVS